MWNDDDDDERKGEDETRCRLIACSSRKAPRGAPGLTSQSDGRIAIVKKVSNILGAGNNHQNKKKKVQQTWVRKRILSEFCTLVHSG